MSYSSDVTSVQTLHGFISGVKISPDFDAAKALGQDSDLRVMATFLEKLNLAVVRVQLALEDKKTSPGFLQMKKSYWEQRPIQHALAVEKAKKEGLPAPEMELEPSFETVQSACNSMRAEGARLFGDFQGSGRYKSDCLTDFPFQAFVAFKKFFDTLEFEPAYLEDPKLTQLRLRTMADGAAKLEEMVRHLGHCLSAHLQAAIEEKRKQKNER